MNHHSRYKAAKSILLFWCLFIGIGALVGGTAMLLEPNGSILQMQGMLIFFQKLPFADILFRDYFFSGIALITVNGITNIAAAVLLLRKKKSGVILGGAFGITLMLWICIQFYMFPANALSISYFVFGCLQAITGYAAWVFFSQEAFSVSEADYPHVGTNPKELVVYFSRMGYTQKAALIAADKLGAEIYEIKTVEPVSGTAGFWWCGRFGIHGWEMPIEPISVDLFQYDHITICSPIWVFQLSAPMKAFCKQANGKIRSVSYILLHYTKSRCEGVIQSTDQMLGITHRNVQNICCRMGKFKKVFDETSRKL